MPTVTIKDVGTTECAEGDRLVLAIEHAGCDILHRCGGNARCATCKVLILAGDAGPMTDAERERLERIADRPDNLRLSCQVQVRDDLTVDVDRENHHVLRHVGATSIGIVVDPDIAFFEVLRTNFLDDPRCRVERGTEHRRIQSGRGH